MTSRRPSLRGGTNRAVKPLMESDKMINVGLLVLLDDLTGSE